MQSKLIKLYLPLLSFIILFSLSFCIDREQMTFNLPFNINSAVSFSFNIDNRILFIEVYYIICFSTLLPYLFFDYSKLFPQHVNMEVFYDAPGIDEVLKNFNNRELENLKISSGNFDLVQKAYFSSIEKEVSTLLKLEDFKINEGILHSVGSTSFVVKKNHGFQQYFISESKGQMEHRLERPNQKELSFKSFFEKLASKNDYASLRLLDIFRSRSVIIKPIYKQIIAEKVKSDGVEFSHTLLGITKIYFFPYPHFSETIYCVRHSDRLFPIGYSIYS